MIHPRALLPALLAVALCAPLAGSDALRAPDPPAHAAALPPWTRPALARAERAWSATWTGIRPWAQAFPWAGSLARAWQGGLTQAARWPSGLGAWPPGGTASWARSAGVIDGTRWKRRP